MKYFLLTLFTFCAYSTYAQNLVPNGSFEDTVNLPGIGNCPSNLTNSTYDEVEIAKGWSSFGNTADYFNSCDSNRTAGVPINIFGYQPAATGHAYCGLYTYITGSTDYREFIGTKLSTALKQGTKYFASVKVNLVNNANYVTNNIGITFSTVSYQHNLNTPIANRAAVYSQLLVTDTLNWTTIAGSFIADSNYQYIIVGNFFDDPHTDIVQNSNVNNQWAYYYVDDVCVSPDSLGCDMAFTGVKKIANNDIHIYPNPCSNRFYISNTAGKTFTVTIFNLLGQPVKTLSNEPVVDVSDIPDGVYLIRINTLNGIIQQRQIVIH